MKHMQNRLVAKRVDLPLSLISTCEHVQRASGVSFSYVFDAITLYALSLSDLETQLFGNDQTPLLIRKTRNCMQVHLLTAAGLVFNLNKYSS